MKMGKSAILAPGKVQYSTRILGIIEKISDEPSLFTSEFTPDPPRDFWEKKPAVILNHAFVQTGHVIVTQFHTNIRREMNFKGQGGVELIEIFKPRVYLKTFHFPVPRDLEIELRFSLHGREFEVKPYEIAVDSFHIEGTFPKVSDKHGQSVENAFVKWESEYGDVPVRLSIRAIDRNRFGLKILDFPENRLQEFIELIDRIWLDRATLEYNREQESKERALKDMTRSYIKTLNKTHFFLLSPDDKWKQRMKRYGVVRTLEDLDIPYIIQQIAEDRCDILVLDLEHWKDLGIDLMTEFAKDKNLQKIPVLCIMYDNSRFGSNSLTYLAKGVYDIFSHDISQHDLDKIMIWMGRDTEYGNGDALVIISPSARNQYRLGITLYREGIKIVKSMSLDNPISTLNQYLPRWVLIDGVAIGKGFDMILVPCLRWATKATPRVTWSCLPA